MLHPTNLILSVKYVPNCTFPKYTINDDPLCNLVREVLYEKEKKKKTEGFLRPT